MKVNLGIDDWEDKQSVKVMVELTFKKENKEFVMGGETEKGSTFSMKSAESETVIREQFIKPYFEDILSKKGEYDCSIELAKLLDEIERGE